MKNTGTLLALVALSFICLAVSAQERSSFVQEVQSSGMSSSQTPVPNAAPVGKLTMIEPSKVCMVRNHAFEEPQIPLRIKGKTYYGCCEMCKNMLAKDRKQRVSVDPVSKRKIDKATAVIGVGANKGVLYFENETNLEKYNSSVAQ